MQKLKSATFWTAVSAVATMIACVIALVTTVATYRSAASKELKAEQAAAALVRSELIGLQILTTEFGVLDFPWALIDNPRSFSDLQQVLTPKLLDRTFESMPNMSAESLVGMAQILAAADACKDLVEKLAVKEFRDHLGDERARANMRAAASDVHKAVEKLQEYWGGKAVIPFGVSLDTYNVKNRSISDTQKQPVNRSTEK